jgi:hypothetical protein
LVRNWHELTVWGAAHVRQLSGVILPVDEPTRRPALVGALTAVSPIPFLSRSPRSIEDERIREIDPEANEPTLAQNCLNQRSPQDELWALHHDDLLGHTVRKLFRLPLLLSGVVAPGVDRKGCLTAVDDAASRPPQPPDRETQLHGRWLRARRGSVGWRLSRAPCRCETEPATAE